MILVAVIALFVALGSAVDAYMYKKEKSRLYQKMEGWIAMIDKTKSTEIHLRMIDMALGIYHRMFNRKKPVRSFVIIVSVSWVLTSVMHVFGVLYSNYDNGNYHVQYWHDFLPWYPAYIVNFIFDAATIFFTIKILERIRGGGTLKSMSGIVIDAIIAYVLLVLCVVSFEIGAYFGKIINIGEQWADHHYDRYTHSINHLDKLSENMHSLEFEKERIDEVFRLGFTDNAKIKFIGADNLKCLKSEIFVFPEAFFNFIKKERIRAEGTFVYEITEFDRRLTIQLETQEAYLTPSHLSTAMTTFLPTLVYLLILLIMYVSKEIIYVTRQFSLRFLKSAVENAAGETFDVSKFKPGLHFGILLGVLSALVKLAIELAKMA
ncbi:MAG: hypothetical protein KDC70_03215 [Saprospiraceae bacterium]|nr:hypothetical protein [Saprospiraceae bacterium]